MENHFVRFLVVDDEPQFANIIKRHLRMEGYEVDVAHEGLQAREMIKKAGEVDIHYDLIITDINMPNLDGIALINWLCAEYPEVSILAISGFGVSEAVCNILRPELDEYCQKPFSADRMMGLISKLEMKRLRHCINTARV